MQDNKTINFWKGMNLAGTAIIINVAFLLCCIPVVTIGPATCGLYSALRYVVRGDGWFNGFRDGIKKHFVRNALVGSVLTIMIAYMAVDFNNALSFYLEGLGYEPLVIYSVGLLPLLMVFSALWPMSVFIPYDTGTDWIKNSLRLLLKAPLQLLAVSVLMLLPVALLLYFPTIGFMMMVVFLGVYYAVAGFASIMLLKNALEDRLGEYRKTHPDEEE